MKGFIKRPNGELQVIINNHNDLHALPKDHCLNGIPCPDVQQDISVNGIISHPDPQYGYEIMYIDLDQSYEQSLLTGADSGKLWQSSVFSDDTFLSLAEVKAEGYFPDPE